VDDEAEVRRLASHAEVVRKLYEADAVALVMIKGRVGTGEAVVWARHSGDFGRDARELLADRLAAVLQELEFGDSVPLSSVRARWHAARSRLEFDAWIKDWWEEMRQMPFHELPTVLRVAVTAVARRAFRAYLSLRADAQVHEPRRVRVGPTTLSRRVRSYASASKWQAWSALAKVRAINAEVAKHFLHACIEREVRTVHELQFLADSGVLASARNDSVRLTEDQFRIGVEVIFGRRCGVRRQKPCIS
jgi:hypothetical protein